MQRVDIALSIMPEKLTKDQLEANPAEKNALGGNDD
jgi:hypothetical protein